jgi:putative ABC transport system ATP-binding protein
MGFVLQEFELLEYLSVRDNVVLPYYVNRALRLSPDVQRNAVALAESMNLGDKLRRYPRTLSQGEKQRVAICRSLITSPRILIADEPTGNLDARTAETIMSLLMREVDERRATLLMVTHNQGLLELFDRTIDVQQYSAGGRQ